MERLILLFTAASGGLPEVRCVEGDPAGLDLAGLAQGLARRFEALAGGQVQVVRLGGRRFRVAVRPGADRRLPELVLAAVPAGPAGRLPAQGWEACLVQLGPRQRRSAARLTATARRAGELVAARAVRRYLARVRETVGPDQAWPVTRAAQLLDQWIHQHMQGKGVADEPEADIPVAPPGGGKVGPAGGKVHRPGHSG